MSYIIEIDNIFFKLLYKYNFLNYNLIYIESSNNSEFNDPTHFCVYPSKSELNMYRLALYDNIKHRFIKSSSENMNDDFGPPPPHPLGQSTDDYIQQTFIHLKLQKFICDNLDDLGYSEVVPKEQFLDDDTTNQIWSEISSKERKIKKGFFYEYHLKDWHKCGWEIAMRITYKQIYNDLQELSNKFQENYKIISNNLLYNYEYIKINEEHQTLNTKYRYSVYSVDLQNKTDPSDNIILYYLIVDFCVLNNTIDNIPSTLDYEDCPYKQYHLPLFLTESDMKITKYGVCSKYITAGNYICKFLDYPKQAIESYYGHYESRYDEYVVIARKYKNIFPFNILEKTKLNAEIPLGKRATELLLRNKYLKYKKKYNLLKLKMIA
jgi:hypothetical protein